MSLAEALLERSGVYRALQAPFAARKLAPILRHNDLGRARRVLDVGCGPGTNTAWFTHAEYLGIDINPRYIASAARRHRRRFIVADVCEHEFPPDQRFDFVLLNSFLHHVSTPNAQRILAAVGRALAPGGAAHILDLVLPARPSPARFLARRDRGGFARPLEEWRQLFASELTIALFEPYPLGVLGLELWSMVYCRAHAK